jgi:NTE family protein
MSSTPQRHKPARNHKPRDPTLGVALSGGGVRGLAHLGVLQVLETEGLAIDAIAGTSMGGLVAGLYAAGIPLGDTIEAATQAGLLSFAAPDGTWRGLFGHRKMRSFLANLLGDEEIRFEDLNIPTAVIAVDIETGEMVILDHGPLIPALLATAAFPIVFSPVRHQDRWLIDGGVLNNLPIDVVRLMGVDRVLGVDVPPSLDVPLAEDHQDGLSARGIFSFNHRTRDWKLPFLIAETSVGITASCINKTRRALCPPDLMLTVQMPNVGLFATDRNPEVIEAGRDVAQAHTEALHRLKSVPLSPSWRARLRSWTRKIRQAWGVLHTPDYQLYPQCVAGESRLFGKNEKSPGD